MPSLLAWLDTTEEEQRVSRELMALFIEPEGRDELGIGQVRDAFSDLLFPGTTTLLTRARYYLLVPWCYRDGRARDTSGEECYRIGRRQERDLIAALRHELQPGETGLIGANLGANVRDLPSVYYWGGLIRFGILATGVDAHHLGLLHAETSEATELAERALTDWDPTLPDPPARRGGEDGFPSRIPGGFNLTPEESRYLTERIVQAVPDTALATVLLRDTPLPAADFAWEVLDDEVPHLGHARLFSIAIHGAQILYNLLIAERYAASPDLDRYDATLVDEYRALLTEWADRLPASDLARWDVPAMWRAVSAVNPRIAPATRAFVDSWIAAIRSNAHGIADNREVRAAVENRERRKGKRSRFANTKLLATWPRDSGIGQLAFRWQTVRRIVDDIYRGRTTDAPA
jgi:hypothetical protein